MYKNCFKRVLDFTISLIGLIVLSPVFLILIILGTVFMGGNPFFVQPRPGKGEKIFKLIKFRSMSNKKDKEGNLLPDELRLNGYGKFLRKTSLDELPELLNILVGDMSLVGPRPQLVRDMVFMTDTERKRHTVNPGLTGLAQVKGRNAISWEKKLNYDLEYLNNISFLNDFKIIMLTAKGVFSSAFGKDNTLETDITDDYGDYLLNHGIIQQEEYDIKQSLAKELLEKMK